MGKAALDLPDPLQTPPDDGKPLTSTDDLLARLAGEEIDRLLAEVDDQAPVGAAPIALAPPRQGAAPEPSAAAVPRPETKAPQAEFPEDGTAAELAAAAEPDLTAELDAFFKSAVPAPAAAAPPAAADAPVSTAAAPNVIAPPLADLLETSQAERQGLHAPASAPTAEKVAVSGTAASATDAAGGATATSADSDEEGGTAGDLPLYLRPLEWINAPLEACPPALRDFIGKAAIITLVNAAAVLLYVVLFRHR